MLHYPINIAESPPRRTEYLIEFGRRRRWFLRRWRNALTSEERASCNDLERRVQRALSRILGYVQFKILFRVVSKRVNEEFHEDVFTVEDYQLIAKDSSQPAEEFLLLKNAVITNSQTMLQIDNFAAEKRQSIISIGSLQRFAVAPSPEAHETAAQDEPPQSSTDEHGQPKQDLASININNNTTASGTYMDMHVNHTDTTIDMQSLGLGAIMPVMTVDYYTGAKKKKTTGNQKTATKIQNSRHGRHGRRGKGVTPREPPARNTSERRAQNTVVNTANAAKQKEKKKGTPTVVAAFPSKTEDTWEGEEPQQRHVSREERLLAKWEKEKAAAVAAEERRLKEAYRTVTRRIRTLREEKNMKYADEVIANYHAGVKHAQEVREANYLFLRMKVESDRKKIDRQRRKREKTKSTVNSGEKQTPRQRRPSSPGST